MKRFIAILMGFVMIMSVGAFASDQNENYKDILLKVKELFDIEDYDDFSYNIRIRTENNKEIYCFSWFNYDDDKKDNYNNKSSLIIDTDKDMNIYNYSYYGNDKDKNISISPQNAQKIADDFIKKINKNYHYYKLNNEKTKYNMENTTYEYEAYVNGHRILNGYIAVEVNLKTGNIDHYYCTLPDYNFNKADEKPLPMEKIKEGFFADNNVELAYKKVMRDGKAVAVPFYVESNILVDALTGKSFGGENSNFKLYNKLAADGGATSAESDLTPVEAEEVEKLGNAVSVDEAVNIIKDKMRITLDKASDKFNYTYYKDDKGYSILIEFDNGNATINSDRKLVSCYCLYKDNEIKGYEDIKKFVNNIYTNAEVPKNIKENDDNEKYEYTFYSKHNNIKDITSYITIGFDDYYNVNTVIYNCFEGEYEEVKKELTQEEIINLASDKLGFELSYMAEDYDLKLVYAFKDYFMIDAVNGAVLDKYGREFTNDFNRYNDVSGKWYEDIANMLITQGYSFKDNEFKGESIVTGKDVVEFFENVDFETYRKIFTPVDTGKYKEYAENPDKNVTRYQIADIIVDRLGYSKLAEKAEFVKAFEDVGTANNSNVAICKSMGIVNGKDGKFKGDEYITRAEMASMVYKMIVSERM